MKKIVKLLLPANIWNILRYIKYNPSYLEKWFYVLKKKGLKEFLREVSQSQKKPLIAGGVFNSFTFYIYKKQKLNKQNYKKIENFKRKPLISVIMPVFNADLNIIIQSLKSIELQWYKNWELCIVCDKSSKKNIIKYLNKIQSSKIKVKFLNEKINISEALNEALNLASGEYAAFVNQNDQITADAFFEVVKVINNTGAEFIYSDEDFFEQKGKYITPHFKPDFSPDMFLSKNYINNLAVIKKNLIYKVNCFDSKLEYAHKYDLYLKVFEQTDKIYHIRQVLYHCRKNAQSFDSCMLNQICIAEKKALENALIRRNIQGEVVKGQYPGVFRIKYKLFKNPLVSIVIPFKDKPEFLKMCVESILSKSTYKNFEIIGISNNSTGQKTFDEMKRLENLDNRIKFYEYNVPFNYSRINNYAVKNFAKGEHIILLNNDIEIITPEWIENMLEHSQREETGCVGAKLYFPQNKTIQHAGVIIGLGGAAGHSHKYYQKSNPGYFSRLMLVQNLSAVTGACLMVKTKIYKDLNGLNEKELKVAYNDVDFCLRVQEKGFKNIFTPYCEAYHHESISRGPEDNLKKMSGLLREARFLQKRHFKIMKKGDPYYNPNLTLQKEDFSLNINKFRFVFLCLIKLVDLIRKSK
jgi:glycosyltransferase involved in cell wall biosynthesis